MATLAQSAGGALLGGAVGGSVGASVGWALSGLAGAMLFPQGGKDTTGPRLSDLSVQSAAYGTGVPMIYGTTRVSGNIIWSSGLRVSESIRDHFQAWQSLRIMRRMKARRRKANAVRLRFSQSLAMRRHRLSHAMVRSTTHRRGSTSKPCAVWGRRTICIGIWHSTRLSAAWNFGPGSPHQRPSWSLAIAACAATHPRASPLGDARHKRRVQRSVPEALQPRKRAHSASTAEALPT